MWRQCVWAGRAIFATAHAPVHGEEREDVGDDGDDDDEGVLVLLVHAGALVGVRVPHSLGRAREEGADLGQGAAAAEAELKRVGAVAV
jgi:hypothetical protein